MKSASPVRMNLTAVAVLFATISHSSGMQLALQSWLTGMGAAIHLPVAQAVTTC